MAPSMESFPASEPSSFPGQPLAAPPAGLPGQRSRLIEEEVKAD